MIFLIHTLSFAISAAAFIFGGIKLFKKKKPLYLQMLVCAAGCFALEELSSLVSLWCNAASGLFSIGMLGILGCNFFLLSANYGTLDKIVDDNGNKKVRFYALAAPAVLTVLLAAACAAKRKFDFSSAIRVLVMLPALPASYFNLKHVLLPKDDFGFLSASRPCNIAALCFYVICEIHIWLSFLAITPAAEASLLLMSLASFGLVFSAVKGAKIWGI